MQWVQGVMVRCVCTDGAGAVLVLLMVLSEAVPPVTVALPGVARGAAAGLKVRRAADGANAAADGSGGVLRLRNVASEGRRRFRGHERRCVGVPVLQGLQGRGRLREGLKAKFRGYCRR